LLSEATSVQKWHLSKGMKVNVGKSTIIHLLVKLTLFTLITNDVAIRRI
jgi:hypothetical protein